MMKFFRDLLGLLFALIAPSMLEKIFPDMLLRSPRSFDHDRFEMNVMKYGSDESFVTSMHRFCEIHVTFSSVKIPIE